MSDPQCERLEEWLATRPGEPIDGPMSAHLLTCPICAERHEKESRLSLLLAETRHLADGPSEEFRARVERQLASVETPRRSLWPRLAAVAAVLLVASGLVLWALTRTAPEEQRSTRAPSPPPTRRTEPPVPGTEPVAPRVVVELPSDDYLTLRAPVVDPNVTVLFVYPKLTP